MKALTRSEIDSLLELANIQERAMILSSLNHGMRAGEVLGLLRSDINMKEKTIVIRRLKRGLVSHQAIENSEYDALKLWLSVAPSSLYVFPNKYGEKLSRMTWHRWFKSLAKDAGIPSAHCHCLRHSLGYFLAEANVTLPIIQQALGHTSPSSSFCYAVPSGATVNKVMREVLNGL